MLVIPKELGLDETDTTKVRGFIQTAAGQGDALLRYWSAERGILWLGLHYGGQLASWLMVPAATAEQADRAAEFWREIVTDGMRVQQDLVADLAKGAGQSPH